MGLLRKPPFRALDFNSDIVVCAYGSGLSEDRLNVMLRFPSFVFAEVLMA